MQIVIVDGKVESWYGDQVDVDETELPDGAELVWIPDCTDVQPEYTFDEEGFPTGQTLKDDPRDTLSSDYRDERDQIISDIESISDETLSRILTYFKERIMKE